MRISDWSSDVCSSDLERIGLGLEARAVAEQDHVIIHRHRIVGEMAVVRVMLADLLDQGPKHPERAVRAAFLLQQLQADLPFVLHAAMRSEEQTPELQSLMRISYAVSSLNKKKLRYHLLNT